MQVGCTNYGGLTSRSSWSGFRDLSTWAICGADTDTKRSFFCCKRGRRSTFFYWKTKTYYLPRWCCGLCRRHSAVAIRRWWRWAPSPRRSLRADGEQRGSSPQCPPQLRRRMQAPKRQTTSGKRIPATQN